MSTTIKLDLGDFSKGTSHLTSATCAALAEAASVCLEQHGHATGVVLGGDGAPASVEWPPLPAGAGASHADEQRATEDGAVALAILLVRARYGYEPVRQSRKGTGFDWHLVRTNADDPFDDARCLEVSGVRDDRRYGLDARLKTKLEQVARGRRGLPGYAVVIGFQTPAARVGEVP